MAAETRGEQEKIEPESESVTMDFIGIMTMFHKSETAPTPNQRYS